MILYSRSIEAKTWRDKQHQQTEVDRATVYSVKDQLFTLRFTADDRQYRMILNRIEAENLYAGLAAFMEDLNEPEETWHP